MQTKQGTVEPVALTQPYGSSHRASGPGAEEFPGDVAWGEIRTEEEAAGSAMCRVDVCQESCHTHPDLGVRQVGRKPVPGGGRLPDGTLLALTP